MVLRTYTIILYDSVESDLLKDPKIEWRQKIGIC